jgi:type I restriction enzyme S subunit
MKHYDSYKDSGIEWIGEIPSHWKVGRIKYIVDSSKYYQIGDGDHGSIKPEMYCDNGIPYIRVQNLNWNGLITKEGLVYIPEDIHKLNQKSKLVESDILIAKTGATIGKLGLVDSNIGESNTTSSVGKITIDKNRFSPKYFLYFFQSHFFQKMIWVRGIEKSAQPGFNIDDLVDFPILILPLSEQEQIVSYLDDKTTKIDKLIQKKLKKIDLLKEYRTSLINTVVTKGLNPDVPMKDSGIEWIGEIPSHWVSTPLKYLCMIGNGRDYSHIQLESGGYPVYGTGGEFSRCSEYLHDGPSVLLGRKGTIDNPILVDGPFWTSDTVYYTVIKENTIPKFLFHLVKQIPFDLYSYGSTIPSMTKTHYENMFFPLPQLSEQEHIVSYLDEKTSQIDKTIDIEKKKIQLLKEYRQSLISNVVTGKLKVVSE